MGLPPSDDLAHARNRRWGCVSLIQGVRLRININCALQPMAGTMVGATLVRPIQAREPPVWNVIAVLFLLQFTTEIIIGANYALG